MRNVEVIDRIRAFDWAGRAGACRQAIGIDPKNKQIGPALPGGRKIDRGVLEARAPSRTGIEFRNMHPSTGSPIETAVNSISKKTWIFRFGRSWDEVNSEVVANRNGSLIRARIISQ